MTKKNRLRRAWERNPRFHLTDGVYYLMVLPLKHQPTPKHLKQCFKRERILDKLFKHLE